MKVTKSQLKKIIQEELESLFSEGRYSYHADVPAGGYADEWERGADAAAATGHSTSRLEPEAVACGTGICRTWHDAHDANAGQLRLGHVGGRPSFAHGGPNAERVCRRYGGGAARCLSGWLHEPATDFCAAWIAGAAGLRLSAGYCPCWGLDPGDVGHQGPGELHRGPLQSFRGSAVG